MGTSYFLWRLAGLGIASELLLTGRTLPAERAYQVGGEHVSAAPVAGAVWALLPAAGHLTSSGTRPKHRHHAAAKPPPRQLGLVNELVDTPAELEDAAKRMAADMMATSRLGLQARGCRRWCLGSICSWPMVVCHVGGSVTRCHSAPTSMPCSSLHAAVH